MRGRRVSGTIMQGVFKFQPVIFVFLINFTATIATAQETPPDYARDVEPLLRKYCQGCHNAEEAEGQLRLDSYGALLKGGGRGPALLPGEAKLSRMIRVLKDEAKPAMPPEDERQPTDEEIALLVAWIDAGAKGPSGAAAEVKTLLTPHLPAAKAAKPITAIAHSPDGKLLAVARYREIELRSAGEGNGEKVARRIDDHPGKVNDLAFSSDGRLLLAATGVTGLYGEVRIWNVANGSPAGKIGGHRDVLYAVAISPDDKLIATGSYDRRVILWDRNTGKPRHEFTQHNGAIYDLAFSPDGKILASASGDETVKLWHVEKGIRLDTLGQGEGEQLAVLFSPDGKLVVAGGADNRIRVWKVVSRDRPQINPLVYARFAHEGSIVALAWSKPDGALVSAADDQTLKLWETKSFTETHLYENQSDTVSAIAASPVESHAVVARLDGSLARYATDHAPPKISRPPQAADQGSTTADGPMSNVLEQEPNDAPEKATPLSVPGTAKGVIHRGGDNPTSDVDLYRFTAKAGQTWIVETKAARNKSPLDTKIEVLDAAGRRIPRVLLQAVRDSYFTFRGKDSTQTGDFRVHNWEEMTLNQYLYAGGEVVKLYRYPRGPDSGFDVYPARGQRWTYFDTPSLSHALGEPCYIVEPHAPGEKIIPNGLPVFTVYYDNDDDSRRKLGKDSRLTFTAPADGEYLVGVSDVRGYQGDKHAYELTVRPPKPDFSVRIEGANSTVHRGSGKSFSLVADRLDDFDGEIRIDVEGVPEGLYITSPIVIQSEQLTAMGAVYARADAPVPTSEQSKGIKFTATATINGKQVSKSIGNLGEIKLADPPKILPALITSGKDPSPPGEIPELVVSPGETVTATLRVQRGGFGGVLSFGKEDAGRNLPHGVYVDNIGLNGVLLLPGQNERTIFITADSWVGETSRLFFLQSDQEGNQCCWPVMLHVRRKG